MLTAMSLSLSTPPSLSLRPSPLLSPPRFFPSPLPNLKSYGRPGVALFPLKCLPGPIRDVENSDDAKEMEMPTSNSLSDISSYTWCAALGGVGFVETAYLTYIKLTNSEAFCPVGGGSCSDVLNSDYASVLAHGSLLTRDHLQKKGMIMVNRCYICTPDLESLARALWELTFSSLGVPWVTSNAIGNHLLA